MNRTARDGSSTDKKSRLQKNIFIGSISGSGAINIVDARILAAIEEKAEVLHISELIHVWEGGSGASILITALNAGMSGRECYDTLIARSPEILPYSPGRHINMQITQGINNIEKLARIDPLRTDALKLREIRMICAQIRDTCADGDCALTAEAEDKATRRWLTRGNKERLYEICSRLESHHPELKTSIDALREVIRERTETGLKHIYRRAALFGLEQVKTYFSGPSFFDPAVARNVYQELWGDKRLSDCARTTYLAANDVRTREAILFACEKNDYFDPPGGVTAYASHNDPKLWDMVMGSTAHPAAYDPHVMEDGRLVNDMAAFHTPTASVERALATKPADTGIQLLLLHTSEKPDPTLTNDDIIRQHREYGFIGTNVSGEFQRAVSGYNMSLGRFYEKLGQDNILEISPRLLPRSYREEKELPVADPLNTKAGQIEAIVNLAEAVVLEHDQAISRMTQRMLDTAWITDRVTDEHYLRVSRKLGVYSEQEISALDPATKPAETSPARPASRLRDAMMQFRGLMRRSPLLETQTGETARPVTPRQANGPR